MPNILDGVGVILDKVAASKCPICEKAKHDTTQDKKQNKGCLDSRPQDLGCAPLPPDPTLPNYTTAAHHLIPANQCLKPFGRLSQMCKAVGYDVNNPVNGLSLPTVGQKSKNVYMGKKYSKLSDADRENTSFQVMDGLDLQWHVGHHNWDTSGLNHVENYDKLVKLKLRDLEKKIKKNGGSICSPSKTEKGKEVITEMNSLSTTIKGKVLAWKTYFVSRFAYDFADIYK